MNDTLGHQAGDQVLCEAANRFRAHCRPNDIIARLGGDEFALILSSSPAPSGAAAIAQRLIQAMAAPIFIQETPVSVGLSIGIARAPGNGTDPDSLFAAADRALYEAKTAGRNRFCFSGGGV